MLPQKHMVNELLAFIQNKMDVMDEVSIMQICTSSFKENEVLVAKKLLYESVDRADRMPSRRIDEKGARSLQDIINLLKEVDPDEVPTFVAKDLQKLPPVTIDHVDVTRLLKDITSLKASLAEMQLKLEASQGTISELRTEVVDLVDEQSTSTLDADAATVQITEPEPRENKNGHNKILKRMETVPDIKRDTSGITTQYVATGIVNLGAFAAGVCVAWSSSALPLLTVSYNDPNPTARVTEMPSTEIPPPNQPLLMTHPKLSLSQAEASWAASLLCLGALWGAIPGGLISEYFGRKKTLLYLALPLVVSWILVASSPNVYGLYVGRFVGGMAVGAFSVGIPPYVEDIAEKHLLPALANFYHVHFSCGVLFGYIIGMVENASWLSVLCAIIPIAFFVAFIFLPESPAYLMSQGKFHEAKAALRYFRGIDNDIDTEIKDLKENIRNSVKNRATFKGLFGTKANIKAVVVSFGLMIFQQMSGIYPVLFYAKEMFGTFSSSLPPPAAAIILGFCLVSTTYFSTMLLKIVRRRVLLMLSFFAMAVSLGSLAVNYHLRASNITSSTWIPLLSLCLFVSAFATGVGPIPWLMLREIFPPNVTRRATALTAGFHWFLAFGVTKLYRNLVDMVKPGWTIWHFAVTCIIGVIFVYFFVPETKGRSLEEIQNEFEGIHKKKKHRHVIEVESLSEV